VLLLYLVVLMMPRHSSSHATLMCCSLTRAVKNVFAIVVKGGIWQLVITIK